MVNAGAGHEIERDAALRARIEAALDTVRPYIRGDGGDVWFVKAEGGVAYVQMVGACGGCSMSYATLKEAIEASVVAACPEITRVEAV
ncbi:MAG: NifU family protein [Candidatus Eremiobacteraeota bacterium]|nr:NifU family protein [Candidatus Eremiobacteraeota bacterium]